MQENERGHQSPLMVRVLQTQPKSWPTEWTFGSTVIMKIVLSILSGLTPLPPNKCPSTDCAQVPGLCVDIDVTEDLPTVSCPATLGFTRTQVTKLHIIEAWAQKIIAVPEE